MASDRDDEEAAQPSKGARGVRFCAVVKRGGVVVGAMQLGMDEEYHHVATEFASELVKEEEGARRAVRTSPVLGRVHCRWFDDVLVVVNTHEQFPDDLGAEAVEGVHVLVARRHPVLLVGQCTANALHTAGANPELLSLLLSFHNRERLRRAQQKSALPNARNAPATLLSKGMQVQATPASGEDALSRLDFAAVADAPVVSRASVLQRVEALLEDVEREGGARVGAWEVLAHDVTKAGRAVKRLLCERLQSHAEAALGALDYHLLQLHRAMALLAVSARSSTKRSQSAYAGVVGSTVQSVHWVCGIVGERVELRIEDALTCVDLIRHPVARRFWATHFGAQCHCIGWAQFESAYTLMDKDGLEIPEVFSPHAVQLFLHHLDIDMQGVVHVCEFDKVTARDGLVGSVHKLLVAQYELPNPPSNQSLSRTLMITGVDVTTITAPDSISTLHTWLGEVGEIACIVPTPTHVGVVIEFAESFEPARIMASENRPQCNRTSRHGRVVAIQCRSAMTVGAAIARISQAPMPQRVSLVFQIAQLKEAQVCEEESVRGQINQERLRLEAALAAHTERRDDRDTPEIREQYRQEEREIIKRFKEKTLELTSRLEGASARYEEEQRELARRLSSNALRIVGRVGDLLLNEEAKVMPASSEFIEFRCSMRGSLLPGKLHVGTTQCLFFAQSWSGVLAKVIDYRDIKILERSDFLLLIPDCIYILTDHEDVRFDGFYSREACFRCLRDRWLAAAGYDQATVVFEGALMTLGSVIPTWSERWCVLTTFALAFYESGEQSSPVDVVPLHTVRSIEQVTIHRYECMKVHGSGVEYVLGSEDTTLMRSWLNVVREALSAHSGLSHLHHNVLVIDNNLFTHTILQVDLDTSTLRLPGLVGGDLCLPFSALQCVELGLHNALELQIRPDRGDARKDVRLYVGSERERRVLKMVLDGVVTNGKEFDLPESLKAELVPVKSAYVRYKPQMDFFASTRWVELTPMGDLVISASPSSPQPQQLCNVVGANLVFEGTTALHVFFATDFHHDTLTFASESERDAWFDAITAVCRNVVNEVRRLEEEQGGPQHTPPPPSTPPQHTPPPPSTPPQHVQS